MPEKKRKVNQLEMVSQAAQEAVEHQSSPASEPASPQKMPDPLSGKSSPYGISMRAGMYGALKHISEDTGIPISRLVERGVMQIIERYQHL